MRPCASYRPHQESAVARIVRGSAVVLGWSHYFKIAHNYNGAAGTLDHHAFWIATKALCRKFDITTAQCLRKYGRGKSISMGEGCTLRMFQDTKMSLNFRGPKPYEPGTGCYLEDLDLEADFRIYEGLRFGSMDFKALALFRDGYRCRKCGTAATYEDSEADHIEPVNRFTNLTQAHHLGNIQILCLTCHQEKTCAR